MSHVDVSRYENKTPGAIAGPTGPIRGALDRNEQVMHQLLAELEALETALRPILNSDDRAEAEAAKPDRDPPTCAMHAAINSHVPLLEDARRNVRSLIERICI
jgi:hypothetical protein